MKAKRVKESNPKSQVINEKLFKQIIENNILLQKKFTETLVVLDNLTKKVGQLVDLFHSAAEKIKKGEVVDGELNQLISKLDNIIELNKNVAKSLVLLEKYIAGRASTRTQLGFQRSFKPKPLPQQPIF